MAAIIVISKDKEPKHYPPGRQTRVIGRDCILPKHHFSVDERGNIGYNRASIEMAQKRRVSRAK